MSLKTLDDFVGNTPLVRLKRMAAATGSQVCVKLEGNNPAGSVKDRPAYSMIVRAEERGEIRPGDTLIEATSGNTGIALAMVAAMRGYRMKLIMPEHMSEERRATMRAFGAEIIPVTQQEGMEGARDLALAMQQRGEGRVLDQFGNADNPRAHYEGTGPEIWRDTGGRVTHFVSSMGTTGTIMGVGRYLKEQNPDVQIIGVQPDGESSIPGIRCWPEAYLPQIYSREGIDQILEVDAASAETCMRELARVEGIFAGVSSGGALHCALQVAADNPGSLVVSVVCDRGDRYISTGVYPAC